MSFQCHFHLCYSFPVAVINFNPTTYTVAEGTVVTVIAVSDKDFEKRTTIMFMTVNGTAIGMCCHDNKCNVVQSFFYLCVRTFC